MSSSPPSDDFDLARDLPVTPADVVALRRPRPPAVPPGLADLTPLAPPPFAAIPDPRDRPTSAGWKEFTL